MSAAAPNTTPPITTITTKPTAPLPPSQNEPTKKQPARLNKVGTAILEDFMLEHGISYVPTSSEGKRLCQKIKDQTAYDAMTPEKVKQWFYRRRREILKEGQEKERSPSASSQHLVKPSPSLLNPRAGDTTGASLVRPLGEFGQSLAPKLSQPQIDTLEAMRTATSNGRIEDTLIRALAQSWNLPRDVLDDYLRDPPPVRVREPLTPFSPTLPHRPRPGGDKVNHRLPTPAETITSPSMSHLGDVFPPSDEPAQTDGQPGNDSRSLPQSPVPSPPPTSNKMDVDPPSNSKSPPANMLPMDLLLKAIIHGIRGVDDTPLHPPSAIPTNTAEFKALWSPMPCLSEALTKIP